MFSLRDCITRYQRELTPDTFDLMSDTIYFSMKRNYAEK